MQFQSTSIVLCSWNLLCKLEKSSFKVHWKWTEPAFFSMCHHSLWDTTFFLVLLQLSSCEPCEKEYLRKDCLQKILGGTIRHYIWKILKGFNLPMFSWGQSFVILVITSTIDKRKMGHIYFLKINTYSVTFPFPSFIM